MSGAEPLLLRFDTFELDERNARLTRDGRPVSLTPKAFAVLCALAREAGRLVTKDALLDNAWGHRHVSDSVLKSTVSLLRAALDDDPKAPRYIETASRRGYRFLAGAVPTPGRLLPVVGAPAASSTLVGRADALARLHAAWQQALAGRTQVVWVTGEPGIGKSTLIDAFVAALPDARRAHGQCVESFGAGEPYLPLLEALGAIARDDPGLPPLLRRFAPMWLLQLPWLTGEADRAALQRELAGANPQRMLRELGELLDQLTRERPLLLVTEDLHWSDEATLRLIDHLARRRTPLRLLWLGSFRPAEVVAADHPLAALRRELKLHRLADEIALEPFSEAEVGGYVGQRLPDRAASERFVRSLHEHTDGLPLFVANLLDDLIARGEPLDGGAVPEAAAAVPDSLAGIIERQLDRLAPELRELLGAASVAGVEFAADTVAAALQRDAVRVREQCDRLARDGHWLHALAVGRLADGAIDARYGFGHALYRHVLYRRLGAAERVELHHRIGLALQRRRAGGAPVAPAELAAHLEQGHDAPAALGWYAQAALQAMARFAPREAAQHAERGLALLPRVPAGEARSDTELTLAAQLAFAASLLHGVGSPESTRAFERTRALADALPASPARAWVLSGLGWCYYVRGEFAAATALGQRLQQAADAHDDPVLRVSACNLLGVTVAFSGDLAGGRGWLERGIALADALGDALPPQLFVVDPAVSMRANLIAPLWQIGLLKQARALADATLQLAEAKRQPMARMLALWCNAMFEAKHDRPERVLQRAEALHELATVHAIGHALGPATWYRGWALAMLGEARAGHAQVVEGYRHYTGLGMLAGAPLVQCLAAEAIARAGDWDVALAHVADGLALAARLGETVSVADLLIERGRIERARGRDADALVAWRAAAEHARRNGLSAMELQALVAACRLPAADSADRVALRELCARLPDGFDARLAAGARELL